MTIPASFIAIGVLFCVPLEFKWLPSFKPMMRVVFAEISYIHESKPMAVKPENRAAVPTT